MSHIRDTWVTRDGRQTARFGHGKRWRARWTGPDGIERGKSFARKIDAEQFLAMKEKSRVRAELLAADGDGIDPSGSPEVRGLYDLLMAEAWPVSVNPGRFHTDEARMRVLARTAGILGDREVAVRRELGAGRTRCGPGFPVTAPGSSLRERACACRFSTARY